ncbi:MAG: hypothetical protein AMS15_01775 [Planctomycetes bacterium DG_23]|nr:MAG: hypothetical protein AMS15_01775 [Planctomycetes bacterium DG_23]
MSSKYRIAVIGSGDASERESRLAEEVGREIGRQGAILVCGGLGGVMESASKGAREAGGLTVGILPGMDSKSANPYIDIPIPTGLGEARNAIVAVSGDAVIAIGGSLGTLSEIAFALKARIPVIALSTWDLDEARLPKDVRILRAKDARDAVAKAIRFRQRSGEERSL